MLHARAVQSGSRMGSTTSQRHRNSVLNALFPPWTPAIRRGLLALAVACSVAAAGLALLAIAEPRWSVDASVERSMQSINWGPLTGLFPVFRWLGGPAGGTYMQVGAIVLVLLLNRRAWMLAIAATAGGIWYSLIVNLVNRPRPTTAEVLQVTEHPGAASFPSGHVIFITISFGLVMLCVGHRYLPRWAIPIGWAIVAAVVLTAAVSRVYVGAHWPTDVLASMFIAGGWLAVVTSIRWISDRALDPDAP
jgi:membrane-associated phospholipid phosphatase